MLILELNRPHLKNIYLWRKISLVNLICQFYKIKNSKTVCLGGLGPLNVVVQESLFQINSETISSERKIQVLPLLGHWHVANMILVVYKYLING